MTGFHLDEVDFGTVWRSIFITRLVFHKIFLIYLEGHGDRKKHRKELRKQRRDFNTQ